MVSDETLTFVLAARDQASAIVSRLSTTMEKLGLTSAESTGKASASFRTLDETVGKSEAVAMSYSRAIETQRAAQSLVIESTDRLRAAQQAAATAATESGDIQSAAARRTSAAVRTAIGEQELALKQLAEAEELVGKRAAETAAAQAEVAATSSGGFAAGLGKAAIATTAVAAGLGFIAFKAVEVAANYQTLTTRLTTSAGESVKNIDMVSRGMLDMSGKVGIAANDLATGMYTVESAGYHGADALKVLQAAAQGAKMEGAQLKTVADATSTALNDYHLPASEAAKVTSMLVTAVGQGKTNMEEFSSSLHSITPLASSVGVTLADVTGELAAMTMHGMSADQASQNLADTLRHLITPTAQQRAEFQQFGLTATEVSDSLGKRGMQGTLEMLSEDILHKMGPSGKVMLDAFNTSKDAANNFKVAIASAPADVKKLAEGLANGTLTLGQYKAELKGMPADHAALGMSFMSLYNNANGFTNALKNGSPQAQTYTQALKAMMGDATGLNTALMLTGENSLAASENIDLISKATADADGNVKGWSEIQGTFNQKMDEFKAALGAAWIELGQKLLPAFTSAVSFIQGGFIPAIKNIGSSIADVGKQYQVMDTLKGIFKDLGNIVKDIWPIIKGFAEGFAKVFGAELIGAMKIVKEALDGIAAAVKFLADLLGPLAPIAGGVVAALLGFKLVSGVVSSAVTGIVGMLENLGTKLANLPGKFGDIGSKVDGAIGKIGAFAGILSGGLTVGLIAVGALLTVMAKQQEDAAHAAQEHADRVNNLAQALGASNGALDSNVRAQAAQTLATYQTGGGTRNLLGDVQKLLGPTGIPTLTDAYLGNAGAQQQLINKLQDTITQHTHVASVTEMATTQFDHFRNMGGSVIGVMDAEGYAAKQLRDIISASNGTFQQAVEKNRDLKVATENNKPAMDALAQSAAILGSDVATTDQKTQALTQTLNILVGSSVSAQAAQDNFTKAIQAVTEHVVDNTKALDGDSRGALANRDSIRQAISAAIEHAQRVFDQTHNLNDSRDALKRDEQALYDNMIKTGMNKDEVNRLLDSLHFLPGTADAALGGMIHFADGTQDHIQRIGDKIIHVSASGSWVEGPGGISTGGRFGPRASGGPIYGEGTSTSDSLFGWLSHGEYVINASSTKKHWDLIEAINKDQLYGMGAPGFAGGGSVGLQASSSEGNIIGGLNSWLNRMIDAFAQNIGSQMAAYGPYLGGGSLGAWISQAIGLTGVSPGWAGPLSVLIMRESGGNPNAINLSDSNAAAGNPSQGLMQTIPSTFSAYHVPGTSWNITDPIANIAAGIRYILARYGDISAVQQANPNLPPRGYDSGGWLMPGLTTTANNTGSPEMILPPNMSQTLMRIYSLLGNDAGNLASNFVMDSALLGKPLTGFDDIEPFIKSEFGNVWDSVLGQLSLTPLSNTMQQLMLGQGKWEGRGGWEDKIYKQYGDNFEDYVESDVWGSAGGLAGWRPDPLQRFLGSGAPGGALSTAQYLAGDKSMLAALGLGNKLGQSPFAGLFLNSNFGDHGLGDQYEQNALTWGTRSGGGQGNRQTNGAFYGGAGDAMGAFIGGLFGNGGAGAFSSTPISQGGFYVDMRGSQVMSDHDMDAFISKISKRMAGWGFPSAGVQVRR